MSTMKATSGHSEACCNLPPVVAEGYEEKGKYETIGDYKTCKYPSSKLAEKKGAVVESV